MSRVMQSTNPEGLAHSSTQRVMGPQNRSGAEQEVEWMRAVNKRLEELSNVPTPRTLYRKNFHVFRVPLHVKYRKLIHFEPELVYLGLFTRKLNTETVYSRGERIKLTMVSAFLKVLKEVNRVGWEELCKRVVDNPAELQRCYFDKEEPQNRAESTVQCKLALDAVFLASFLSGYLFEGLFKGHQYEDARNNNIAKPDDEDRARYRRLGAIVRHEAVSFHTVIANDIFKLENQIPLTLIGKVLAILYRGQTDQASLMLNELCHESIKLISTTLPGFSDKHFEKHFRSPKFDFGSKCDHLLACVCRVMHGDTGNSKPETVHAAPFRGGYDFWEVLRRCVLWVIKLPSLLNHATGGWFLERTLRNNPDKEKISLPSVTMLLEAGIHVRGDTRGTFDLVPQFKPGILTATLYIPSFSIVHRTEILWKNMVAYESETVDAEKCGVQDQFIYFLKFMDELVNREEDVSLLRRGRHPVIPQNLLGTEKDVADLFNSLSQEYTVDDPRARKWVVLRSRIHGYFNQRSRKMNLEFLRTNFGKPWLVVSLVAATVLLVMTLIQTYYAVKTYYFIRDHP